VFIFIFIFLFVRTNHEQIFYSVVLHLKGPYPP